MLTRFVSLEQYFTPQNEFHERDTNIFSKLCHVISFLFMLYLFRLTIARLLAFSYAIATRARFFLLILVFTESSSFFVAYYVLLEKYLVDLWVIYHANGTIL